MALAYRGATLCGITEEIQLLIAASDEAGANPVCPALVATTDAGARLFSDRRERGLESAKWTAYVREVEANMDRRISRVEHALEGQSSLIEDLHSKSTTTEDSVRKLLPAVEGFCAQTTRQLEAISAPATAVAAAEPGDCGGNSLKPRGTPDRVSRPGARRPSRRSSQAPIALETPSQEPPSTTAVQPLPLNRRSHR